MTKRFLVSIMIGFLMLCFVGGASASVIYNFEAYSSYPWYEYESDDSNVIKLDDFGNPIVVLPSIQGSFQLTVDTFISAYTFFYPDQLDSGSIITGLVPEAKLSTMEFNFYPDSGVEKIEFGLVHDDLGIGGSIGYFFDLGAFGAVGTYDTVWHGEAQRGRLVVSQTGVPSVPEPATMMLFSLGLLGLAGVNRRKK